MTGVTYAGTYFGGITLTNPTTQNPATITGEITIANAASPAAGTALLGHNGSAWSVTNTGTIASTGSVGVGIYLQAGGSVTNGSTLAQTALVDASTIGVYVTGATGTITNFGQIESPTARGVLLRSGGNVANGASNDTSAVITGGFLGVSAYRGVADVQNYATIAGGTSAGLGVEIYGGSVHNSAGGLISGAYGIGAVGATATVVNAGSIAAAVKDGIALLYGGSVSNLSGGRISAAYLGVLSTALATIANAGAITGSKIGVELEAGGSLANLAGGTIAGSYGAVLANGLTLSGSATLVASLTNGGLLQGTSIDGVVLLAAGTLSNQAGGMIVGATYGVFVEATAGTIINYGTISGVTGLYGRAVTANNQVYVPSLTIVNGGTISGSGGTALSLFNSQDLLRVEPGASFVGTVVGGTSRLELAAGNGALAVGGFSGFTAATIDAGGNWALSGTLAASTIENDGMLAISSGGSLRVGGAVTTGTSASGAITIGASATLTLVGSVAAAQTITFGTAAKLSLITPGAVAAAFGGFTAGDTLILPNASSSGLALSYSGTNTSGALTVTQNGTVYASLALRGQYTASGFHLTADAGGGSDITYMPCFLAGTHIATPEGERPVETLRVGDEVITASGATARIVWIGQRQVDCRRHPSPALVTPVRIAAHAFGAGRSHRDLLLSPDHAILHGGVLIPVGVLIDAREPATLVEYLHIELPRHDLLLAENLAVESYLETGNRWQLVGQASARRPVVDAARAAPLALSGRAVAQARRLLASRTIRRVQGEQSPSAASVSAAAVGRSALKSRPFTLQTRELLSVTSTS